MGPSLAAEGERKDEFVTQAMKWPVERLYTPLDLEAHGVRLPHRRRVPRRVSLHTRHRAERLPHRAVEDVAGHRVRNGSGLGRARAVHARPGPQRADPGVRPPDDQRVRLRPPPRHGRGRASRHGHRLAGRHGGHPRPAIRQARVPHVGLQRSPAGQPGDDHRRPRAQGCRPELVHPPDAQRHPHRVHVRGPLQSTRPSTAFASPPTSSSTRSGTIRTGSPCRSSALSPTRPEPTRCRSWPSRSRWPWSTSTRCSPGASTSRPSRPTSASSPASTWTSSRRSASCGPIARCGPGS